MLALPRGGVPVAAVVAQALHATFDVLVVRKLGAPGNPEFAIGAMAEDGTVVLGEGMLERLPPGWLDSVVERERVEAARRVDRYRGGGSLSPLAGRCVVLVDDGMATGMTMASAVAFARAHGAARVVVAVPTASDSAVAMLERSADEVVACEVPAWFGSVGERYERFGQVTDEEVVAALESRPVGDLP